MNFRSPMGPDFLFRPFTDVIKEIQLIYPQFSVTLSLKA